VARTPEQLASLRNRLLRLHKTLLDSERAAYERAYGRVESSGEWLQIVLGHEHFSWLRPFSGLIVRIDEWLAAKERPAEEESELWREIERLTTLSASTEERALRYRRAIDRSADAAVAHAAVHEILGSTQRQA
jgi:hypothetical protein